MIPLSPMFFVSAATAMLAGSEVRVWRGGGAGLVNHIGFRSLYDHYDRKSSWPLPQVDDCDEMARIAAARGILSTGWPTIGEIVLWWSDMEGAYTRAGIIVHAPSFGRHVSAHHGETSAECVTIEAGGSADQGSRAREGLEFGVRQVVRKISCEKGHRFVRWVDLDGHWRASNRTPESARCAERMRQAPAA
jgi:hypothetical protein